MLESRFPQRLFVWMAVATYTCWAAATEARTAKMVAAENCMLTVLVL